MRHLRSVISSIGILVLLIFPVQRAFAQTGATSTQAQADAQAKAAAQAKEAAAKTASQARAGAQATSQTDIKLDKPSWQAVLDKLFGTPDKGLLDGKTAFQFRAENLNLTAAQAAAFFASSSASASTNLAALIEATEALHGQVRMDGTIDGKPFELKLAGREMKIEGISLTTAQRDALSAELRGISGLHEAKIDALVDGKVTMMVIAGGKERISLLGGERPESNHGNDKQKLERPQKVDIEHKVDVEHRVEVDHGVGADTRVEHEGRIGGVIEKPELPRIGK